MVPIAGQSPPSNGGYVHGRRWLEFMAGIYHVQQIPGEISTDYTTRCVQEIVPQDVPEIFSLSQTVLNFYKFIVMTFNFVYC